MQALRAQSAYAQRSLRHAGCSLFAHLAQLTTGPSAGARASRARLTPARLGTLARAPFWAAPGTSAIGRRLAFTLYCALMATGLVMFTVFWPAIALHPALVLAFLFVAGLGTGTWSGYGPMMSELFPTAVRGTAMSILMNLTRGVQFLAPVVIAAVAPRWGMSGGIALAAGFAVLAGAWIWILPETRGRRIAA